MNETLLLWKAVILGLVEGATEFIPVSSTGHLILMREWLNWTDARADAFIIFVQLPAILAVVWVYRAKIWHVLKTLQTRDESRKLTLNIVLATLPAVIIGLPTDDWVERTLYNPVSVAAALFIGGIAILIIERRRHTSHVTDVDHIPVKLAIGVGLFQVLAVVFPGVSRSAATIIGGLVLGLSRLAATEFSFFLAIPAMFGATALKLWGARATLGLAEIPIFAVGGIVAFVSALVVIRGLLAFISKSNFVPFAWYRIGLSLVLVAVYWSEISAYWSRVWGRMSDPRVSPAVAALIEAALVEDIGAGDWTTLWTVPEDRAVTARMIARTDGVLAGTFVAETVFRTVDATLVVEARCGDGQHVGQGEIVMTIAGSARSVLMAERVALNFTQRLSGVATLARAYVEAVAGTGAVILDTRKTTPGMRALEKAAVSAGGAANHRFGLHDMVLIKENHIVAAGGITSAVRAVRARNTGRLKVEVETTCRSEIEEALAAGVDRILFDNMGLPALREAVALVREAAKPVETEASGGVTLATVRAIADTGVDFISVGALTHSAPALDLSLLVDL